MLVEKERLEREIMGADEEDQRREASIASAASLQPNFKPGRGVSQSQLAKFRELHNRRLQIKAKSKHKRKPIDMVDEARKSCCVNVVDEECADRNVSTSTEDSKVSTNNISISSNSVLQQTNVEPKKRRKLHWGLDAKERWERKSNM